jgi:hypothetical protein
MHKKKMNLRQNSFDLYDIVAGFLLWSMFCNKRVIRGNLLNNISVHGCRAAL